MPPVRGGRSAQDVEPGAVVHSHPFGAVAVRDLGLPSDGVTCGSSRWTLAVGAAGVAVLLSGCVQGPPAASGTLPPLPSASPDVSAETPTPSAVAPSPSPEEEPAAPSDPGTPSAAATPTPTATPTAPVPDGLTPIQLEAAAFVEEFFESFARALIERDTTLASSLMTPECECRGSVALLQTIIEEGGVQEGGEIVVNSIEQVFGGSDSEQIQIGYVSTSLPGQIVYPDGTSSTIKEESGPQVINLQRVGDSFLVRGVVEAGPT